MLSKKKLCNGCNGTCFFLLKIPSSAHFAKRKTDCLLGHTWAQAPIPKKHVSFWVCVCVLDEQQRIKNKNGKGSHAHVDDPVVDGDDVCDGLRGPVLAARLASRRLRARAVRYDRHWYHLGVFPAGDARSG